MQGSCACPDKQRMGVPAAQEVPRHVNPLLSHILLFIVLSSEGPVRGCRLLGFRNETISVRAKPGTTTTDGQEKGNYQ